MNLFVVTGTTKGLGAALREVLAQAPGNFLVCLSRAPANESPPLNVHVDLADTASIAPAFAQVETALAGQRFERAVLINNAGLVAPVGRFDAIDDAATATNLNVNLLAPMVLTRLFVNATRSVATQRLVINISSGAAKRAIAGWGAYCTAKAGLEMATRVAALEAEPGLAICSLAPGVVDTPMQAQVRGANEQAFPDVERFRAMKADGVLRAAGDVARDIIRLIDSGKLTNGGNFDIREMTA